MDVSNVYHMGSISNKEAMKFLSKLYANGIGTAKDPEAAKLWEDRSDKAPAVDGTVTDAGSAEASGERKADIKPEKEIVKDAEADIFIEALEYYLGSNGKVKDYKKAFELISLIKESENSAVSSLLGEMYEYGRGVEQDYKKAAEYYTRGAERGDDLAQNRLGFLYEYGLGVEKDHKKAVYYYTKSADNGNPRGQYNLGMMYKWGWGVEQDNKKAKEYFELSAKQGWASALNALGKMYRSGDGVEKDYKKAVDYFEMSAHQGHAPSQCNLGYMYECGLGVEQDYKKAFDYYKKAADQDYAGGQYNLGFVYEQGYGVEQDYKKAFDYYQKAADQGHDHAMYRLSLLYEEGKGVEENLLKAADYLLKAAEQGNESAKKRIEEMEKGTGSKKKSEKTDNTDVVSLNTRKNHPLIGDESRFIRIRESDTDLDPLDRMALEPDKEYEVFIVYDNSSETGVASDVRVGISEEDKEGYSFIKSFVTSTNAEPVNSELFLKYDTEQYSLQFTKRATIISKWDIKDAEVSTGNLFSKDGMLVGVNKQDGRLPAGADFSGVIFFRLRLAPKTDSGKAADNNPDTEKADTTASKEPGTEKMKEANDDLVVLNELIDEASGYTDKEDTLNLFKTHQKIIGFCMKMIDKDSLLKDYAMQILGSCFAQGKGVPKNIDTAIYWYEKAVAEGAQGAEESLEKLKALKEAGD